MIYRHWYTCIVAFLLYIVSHPVTGQQKVFSIYFIGDAGEPSLPDNGLKSSILAHYDSSVRSSFVFLGDNIYPKGLPPKSDPDRSVADFVMKSQVDLAGAFPGHTYFVPGNHDWDRDGKHGWERVVLQQQWIDSLKNPFVHFLPQGGCPGPVAVTLSNDIVMIVIDSQWFLHPWDKPEGDDSPCEMKQPEDVALQLKELLERHQGKRIIVAAHHPIFTYGEHGGTFTLKDHLFPLTAFDSSRLYIPLPIIGSVYPLYRKFIGSRQDVAHPLNKQYRNLIRNVLEQHTGIVYANGHEHTLQYSVKDSVHYVTSGSGVKVRHVKKKGYAQFVSAQLGYVRMDVFENGTATLSYFEVLKDKSVFQVALKAPEKADAASEDEIPPTGHFVKVHASDRYSRKRTSRWLGENYRTEWRQDIEVPVFDLGGWEIVQKGGGMQTLSLRLEDSVGNQFTLRSVEKYPEKAVPEMFQKTFAQDLVQDQISAAHPYAALVIPALADAAGIYHTNPKIVFIPDDPRLGIYRKEFANTLALFEERPDGEAKDKSYFGNADKIVGTDKVLEKLANDIDNRVDQRFVLRSRLFDLVIGDWDRHDDQWRWAVFKDKKDETYRPIPRDRDQAFFYSDGWLASFWSRRWALPKFEGFREEVRWTPGFMYNARYFDRNFLNGLPAETWVEEAESLQAALTDDAIRNAIGKFPAVLFDLHGEEIIRKIKARRDDLVKYAEQHYAFLAREVDVAASDKKEWFGIRPLENGDVSVTISKINKSGEQSPPLYSRTFKKEETREIRLYGLGDDDVFDLQGGNKSKITIRLIGGDGMDSINNTSSFKPIVYDVEGDIKISKGQRIADRTSSDPAVNTYDRKSFRYPRLAPLAYGNFNNDDGLFVGGGFLWITHGFRKQPYKSQHLFLASYAPLTSSYNFKYDGKFTQVFGKWGIELDFDWKAPNYVNNFFGLGNETEFDSEIDDAPGFDLERAVDYYRVRLQQVEYAAKLTRPVGEWGTIKIGPVYQHVEIEAPGTEERFITSYAESLDEPLLEVPKSFAGVTTEIELDHRDSKVYTTHGAMITYRSLFMEGLDAHASDYTSHDASMAFYHTFRLPARVTFGFRAGGGFNTGNYELYQAQILDGKTELRGYRKTRFYGDSRFYTNTEIRVRLAKFKSYLFPANLGMHAFYDVGRVWYKDENGNDPSATDGSSSLWHNGIGGGLWFTPFNLTTLSTEIAHGEEGNMFYIRLGFLF